MASLVLFSGLSCGHYSVGLYGGTYGNAAVLEYSWLFSTLLWQNLLFHVFLRGSYPFFASFSSSARRRCAS